MIFFEDRMFPVIMKEFSKKHLIFLVFRAIVTYGSIKVEQRVDESPLFLVGSQQERVTSGGCALARMEDVADATVLGTRVSQAKLDSMVSNKKEYAPGDAQLAER